MNPRDIHGPSSPSQKKSAGDVSASRRVTDKEFPLPADPTLPEMADALERLDAGQRLALPMYRELLARAAAPSSEDSGFDQEIAEGISERLKAARTEFISAMKLADLSGDRGVHVCLGEFVNEIDDFGAVLAERWAS